MNLQDLNTLLDYNYWARDRLLDAIGPLTAEQLRRDLGGSFGSIHDTVAHLYAAELVWYDRWQGESRPLIGGDAFPDPRQCRAELDPHLEQALRALRPTDREALLLVAWEDLTPSQAARALGIRPTAFRVRLLRARRRLCRALDASDVGGRHTSIHTDLEAT